MALIKKSENVEIKEIEETVEAVETVESGENNKINQNWESVTEKSCETIEAEESMASSG